MSSALSRMVGLTKITAPVAPPTSDGFLERGADAGVVGGDGLFDGLAQVVPQMPGVGDLLGLRGAAAGAFGIGSGPVPADDLYFRMALQPCGQRFGVPAGQHVHRAPPLQIHQDRGVRVALP